MIEVSSLIHLCSTCVWGGLLHVHMHLKFAGTMLVLRMLSTLFLRQFLTEPHVH